MIEALLAIEPLSWLGILSAMLSGAIIGLERQMLGKPVGIRTSMLICVGTYVFIAISTSVSNDATDPSRVIGQVVTGIGFLGAGVMLSRDGLVYGVTSASAIWILAAIGVVIGCANYLTGIKLAILAVVILVGVDMLENSFKAMRRGVHGKFNPGKQQGHE
jgi:putative Mg2+ transporter-C (MgtC) family protein